MLIKRCEMFKLRHFTTFFFYYDTMNKIVGGSEQMKYKNTTFHFSRDTWQYLKHKSDDDR